MYKLTAIFLACLIHISIFGQVDTLEIRYFNDSTISTIQTISNGWGDAFAYDKSGKVIYHNDIRRVAGIASVKFTYHKNGVIRKAEYYSAPDGGIQWQRVETYFNENGVKLREIKDSHDRMNQLLDSPSEQVFCSPIHKNEVFVKNDLNQKLLVTIIDSDTTVVDIMPGDVKLVKSYISAEITQPPSHFMKIIFTIKKRRSLFKLKRRKLSPTLKKQALYDSETHYTYTIVPE